jgi:hypothetical protein
MRLTPEQALAHPWIKEASKERVSSDVLRRLESFKK